MNIHLFFYYLGIAIVFITHIYMLMKPSMNMKQMQMHAIINLVAALFIAYYFMNKEGFIKF